MGDSVTARSQCSRSKTVQRFSPVAFRTVPMACDSVVVSGMLFQRPLQYSTQDPTAVETRRGNYRWAGFKINVVRVDGCVSLSNTIIWK